MVNYLPVMLVISSQTIIMYTVIHGLERTTFIFTRRTAGALGEVLI